MKTIFTTLTLLASLNAFAGSSNTFSVRTENAFVTFSTNSNTAGVDATNALRGSSTNNVSDTVSNLSEASADSVSAMSALAWGLSMATLQFAGDIVVTSAEQIGNGSKAVYKFSGNFVRDLGNLSQNGADAQNLETSSVTILAKSSNQVRELYREVKGLSRKAWDSRASRASRGSSVAIVKAFVDVSGVILVAPSRVSQAISNGKLVDASKVLVYLPSDILVAAFEGNDYHYQILITE